VWKLTHKGNGLFASDGSVHRKEQNPGDGLAGWNPATAIFLKIERKEKVTEWKPMKEAPKDGTKILLFWEEQWIDDDLRLEEITISYWQEAPRRCEYCKRGGYPSFSDWYGAMDRGPSGWMPLPPPPEAQ
jgi:hypothetical protein